MPYGCPQYAGGKNIPNIVMFHAVVIAVFVVDYQGIIGVPSLQTQRFILAGYDLREQLLKTPEVFMGGGIPSGLMRGWRFFRWWSQISLICRHDDLLPASNRLWHKGVYFIRLWDSLNFCKYRLRADWFFRRFTGFIGHSAQNIVIVGLPDLPLRGAAHFFYFIRNVISPDGVRFFLLGYIRVSARFDQGVQQIGKAGPGEVSVAIVKTKGNAVLSTELCAVRHLALKLPVPIGREQAADLPAFFRPVVVCNAIRQHLPHRLMEFRGIEVGAGQDTLFCTEWYDLSFIREDDGVVRVQGIDQKEPPQTHLFDIAVVDGSIQLTEDGQSISHY